MSRSAPRRSARPPKQPRERSRRLVAGTGVLGWLLVVAAGLGVLLAQPIRDWPLVWGEAGAVTVSGALVWALARRTGGRPWAFGGLALLIGGLACGLDLPWLRAGAAVLTAVAGAVLGVMVTVPARRFRVAAREVVIALLVGAVGALASIGYHPAISLPRWEYTSLALALALGLVLVFRLGAGLHGLGRRGVVMILGGSLVLAVSLAYGELLRRYGSPAIDTALSDIVTWSRDHLGAFPRPLQTLLGIPALVWGVHQRARRRQGWWVCAFGVAATVPPAHLLANPAIPVTTILLVELYTLLLGLVLGYLLIRLDLFLTSPRGVRGRRAEEATAVRPEPSRFASL